MDGRKLKDDRGAALVEMTLVGVLLCFLLFGIVIFGYLMSFRQNMTQAANDGARAAAVVKIGDTPDPAATAIARADESLHSFNQSCGSVDCSATPPAPCTNNPQRQCITLTLTKHNISDLMPNVPLVSSLLPENVSSSATVEVSP